MSLRTIQRVTMMSVWALGAVVAVGCDDTSTSSTDGGSDGGGGSTGGTSTGGEQDAGDDAGGGEEPTLCGDPVETCTGEKLLSAVDLAPCCASNIDDEEVCGIDASTIPGFEAAFAECQEKDRGTSSDEASFCEGILDAASGDKGIDLQDTAGINIKLGGCCTLEGFCGVATNKIPILDADGNSTGNDLSLFLGCVSLGKFEAIVPEDVKMMGLDLDKVPCVLDFEGGAGDGG